MSKLDEQTIKAILSEYESSSLGSEYTKITAEREKALKMYRGDPMGNERPGYSQVISTDVADTVESVLPSLMRVFFSSDRVVEYLPTGDEDVENAELATDYANFILTNDNDGFLVFYEAFKDALIQKSGFIKQWWEEKEVLTRVEKRDLTDDEYALLLQQDDVEIIEHTENVEELVNEIGQPVSVLTHDVAIKIKNIKKRVRLQAVPPEEFLIINGAKTIDEAVYCAHVMHKSASDLIAEGYDRAEIEALPTSSGAINNTEEFTRNQDSETGNSAIEHHVKSGNRLIRVVEHYVRIDADDDGIAELRMIVTAGEDSTVILENEEIEECPISMLTPIIMPHQFFGRSYADLTMDIQEVKTAVQRQTMDNFYLNNNPQAIVNVKDIVNVDDVLNPSIGGVIRAKSNDAVSFLQVPKLGNDPFTVLEYMDSVRETRTGVTRYNQGLDADSLNKTASGINQIMGAAAQREELTLRIMAEGGVKRVFKQMLKLITRHQDEERMVRLSGKTIAVDPSQWNPEMDVSISVGLGTNNKDQQSAHHMNIHGLQVEAAEMQGGLDGVLVTKDKILAGYRNIAEVTGLKNADSLFNTKEEAAQIEQLQQEQAMMQEEQMMMEQAAMEEQAMLEQQAQAVAGGQQVDGFVQ